jgi:hypothetical protein
MKLVRIILFLLFLIVPVCLLYSIPRSEAKAIMMARKFYTDRKKVSIRSIPDFQLVYTDQKMVSSLRSSDHPAFYVFNIGKDNGFVIVSGDDAAKSILGYSDKGAFSSSSIPENLQGWLSHCQREIRYAREHNFPTMEHSVVCSTSVEPLLGAIQWDQEEPYNLLCPYDTLAGKHALTGCVATATAQVMKYHRWPLSGIGSKSYKDETYDTLFADFGHTVYDWDNMPDSGSHFTSRQDTAVATLMYHCGVAVEMNYGVESSGANLGFSGLALIRNFGYDAHLQLYSRSFFTEEQWKSSIISELEASRPVLYEGFDNVMGHAFVCDGCDGNSFFHINWGWSGACNGYFELSALGPDTLNFSENQRILVGVRKPDEKSLPTYQMGMYSRSLTPSVQTLYSVSDQTFDLSLGYFNYGLNDFTGKYGVGLFKNETLQKCLYTDSLKNLKYLHGVMKDTIYNLSLSDIAPGKYQLACIYQPADSVSWSFIRSTQVWKNSLDITISGSLVLIAQPGEGPLSADSAGRGWTIRQNPVGEVLALTSNEPVLEMAVYDLSGRLLQKAESTEMMLVNKLRPSLYLLRVKTKKGTASACFVKDGSRNNN